MVMIQHSTSNLDILATFGSGNFGVLLEEKCLGLLGFNQKIKILISSSQITIFYMYNLLFQTDKVPILNDFKLKDGLVKAP